MLWLIYYLNWGSCYGFFLDEEFEVKYYLDVVENYGGYGVIGSWEYLYDLVIIDWEDLLEVVMGEWVS